MESVISSLLHYADSQPDATAVIDYGHRITYGELGQRVRATAAWLYETGVRTGDTAALSLDLLPENSLRSLQFFYALAYLGAVVLPLSPETPASRRVELVGRFNARWLISSGTGAQIANAALIDPTRFDWGAKTSVEVDPLRGDDPGRPFLHLFTSGTTGMPKVCLFTFGQFATRSAPTAIGPTANDRQMAAVPWPALAGLRSLFRIHAVGGTFVNAPFPETKQELATLINDDLGITQLGATPWQIRRLLQSEMPAGVRLPALCGLQIAGAFISPREIQTIRKTITPNVYIDYGCNEMGKISVLGPEDPVTAGSVGKLYPGMEGQAVDDEHKPLPSGTIGNLRFRSPWMPQAYVGNATATAQRFRDGWFYPGDVGSIDAAGYITLSGRTDDIINFGGIKISPADIEAVLEQHPDVVDAAVVGIPDPMSGQVVVAFVVLRRDIPRESLYNFCAERIDGNRIPTHFMSVREIARNPDGKIQRDRLRDDFLSQVRSPGS